MSDKKYNFRQIILAREYRGLSQSQLSQSIRGLSQPNLSKYEKGIECLSEHTIKEIIKYLEFPDSFFKEKISNSIDYAHFRKRATISKKDRVSIETNIKLIGFVIDKMADSIEWPDYKFSSYSPEEYSPEDIADYIRRKLRLNPLEPVLDINRLIENFGVIIVQIDTAPDKFDGASFITDKGTPIIVINKNFSNDRKRFTIVHELGHLIMHIIEEEPISKYRNVEEEANRFASEFLMPKEAICNSLRTLKLSELIELKKYWLTSMASILYRARFLGSIDENRYKYLNIELSRRGWKKQEPYEVLIDEPKLFYKAYRMHREELAYTHNDLVYGFALPYDLIKSLFNPSSHHKLRIVH